MGVRGAPSARCGAGLVWYQSTGAPIKSASVPAGESEAGAMAAARRVLAEMGSPGLSEVSPGLFTNALLRVFSFEPGLLLGGQLRFQRLAEHVQRALPPKALGFFDVHRPGPAALPKELILALRLARAQ